MTFDEHGVLKAVVYSEQDAYRGWIPAEVDEQPVEWSFKEVQHNVGRPGGTVIYTGSKKS